MKYERRIYLGLICWLIFGDIIASGLLSLPFVASSPILSAIAKIFSLSDLLSSFFALISDAIMSFWRIIPFLR